MLKVVIAVAMLSAFICDVSCVECGCKKGKLKRGVNMLLDDMQLDHSDIMKINGFKGYDKNAKKWPGNIIKFAFHPQFPDSKKQIVRLSLDELQTHSGGCIKYIESNNGYHIRIESNTNGCWSFIGMIQKDLGYQELYLQEPGCLNSKGTIKHEFIHALGFMHTQMRADRDKYVDIFWDKIDAKHCDAFTLCESCVETVKYKTNSVMHYPSNAFGCTAGTITMLGKGGQKIEYNHDTIGVDLQMILDLYCE